MDQVRPNPKLAAKGLRESLVSTEPTVMTVGSTYGNDAHPLVPIPKRTEGLYCNGRGALMTRQVSLLNIAESPRYKVRLWYSDDLRGLHEAFTQ